MDRTCPSYKGYLNPGRNVEEQNFYYNTEIDDHSERSLRGGKDSTP